MLGIGGKFAGAKGMVAVPDLSNKTPDEALALLQAAGLKRSGLGSASTSNSGLNNKVFQQSVSAGYLVDYETEISYDYYYYVAPAAPEPYLCGDWYQATQSTGYDCYGEGNVDYIITENRKDYCLNGVPTGSYIVDPNSINKMYNQAQVKYEAGKCGCCTPTCQPEWNRIVGSGWCGSCINGQKIYAYREKNSCTGEERIVDKKVPCCSFIGCGSTYTVSTGTWTYDIRQNCYADDGACDSNGGGCTTTTKTVGSGCIEHCDIWRDVTSCTTKCGTTKKQSQKCQASDCSYYYNYRTVSCPC